jgi:hypothetical protein
VTTPTGRWSEREIQFLPILVLPKKNQNTARHSSSKIKDPGKTLGGPPQSHSNHKLLLENHSSTKEKSISTAVVVPG